MAESLHPRDGRSSTGDEEIRSVTWIVVERPARDDRQRYQVRTTVHRSIEHSLGNLEAAAYYHPVGRGRSRHHRESSYATPAVVILPPSKDHVALDRSTVENHWLASLNNALECAPEFEPNNTRRCQQDKGGRPERTHVIPADGIGHQRGETPHPNYDCKYNEHGN